MDIIDSDYSYIEETLCYCSEESAKLIRDKIRTLPEHAIHLIGSGDCHYQSLFWIEKISEPFSLVLIDNHPDDQAGAFDDGLLSCGNWLRYARDLAMMKNDYWVRRFDDIPDKHSPLYLSIDLDVLSQDYVHTDWSQGVMTLDELDSILIELCSNHRILGVDICGCLLPSQGATEQELKLNSRTLKHIIDTISLYL